MCHSAWAVTTAGAMPVASGLVSADLHTRAVRAARPGARLRSRARARRGRWPLEPRCTYAATKSFDGVPGRGVYAADRRRCAITTPTGFRSALARGESLRVVYDAGERRNLVVRVAEIVSATAPAGSRAHGRHRLLWRAAQRRLPGPRAPRRSGPAPLSGLRDSEYVATMASCLSGIASQPIRVTARAASWCRARFRLRSRWTGGG